jgi:hypothetical protein
VPAVITESLIGETYIGAFLMDLGFGPIKRLGGFTVGIDESIDVLSKLFNRCEGCVQDLPSRIENQISTWLSQEARVGVKWKCTFGCCQSVCHVLERS